MDWQKNNWYTTLRFVTFLSFSFLLGGWWCCCAAVGCVVFGPQRSSPGCARLRLTQPEEVVTDASRFIGNIRKKQASKGPSFFSSSSFSGVIFPVVFLFIPGCPYNNWPSDVTGRIHPEIEWKKKIVWVVQRGPGGWRGNRFFSQIKTWRNLPHTLLYYSTSPAFYFGPIDKEEQEKEKKGVARLESSEKKTGKKKRRRKCWSR